MRDGNTSPQAQRGWFFSWCISGILMTRPPMIPFRSVTVDLSYDRYIVENRYESEEQKQTRGLLGYQQAQGPVADIRAETFRR